MPTNNFKIFDQGYLDMMPDAEYESSQQRLVGVAPGIAEPDMHNKLYRQATTLVWALAELVKDTGFDALDYDPTGLIVSLRGAIQSVAAGGNSLAFKGYIGPDEPVDPAIGIGDIWIQSSALPTTFPVTGVQQWDGSSWTGAPDYSPSRFDLFTFTPTTNGYYWFSGAWNLLDMDVDLSGYVDTSSDQAVGGNKSFSLAVTGVDPSSPQHFATKAYVDAASGFPLPPAALYVDAINGNDANSGASQGSALKTINSALSKIPNYMSGRSCNIYLLSNNPANPYTASVNNFFGGDISLIGTGGDVYLGAINVSRTSLQINHQESYQYKVYATGRLNFELCQDIMIWVDLYASPNANGVILHGKLANISHWGSIYLTEAAAAANRVIFAETSSIYSGGMLINPDVTAVTRWPELVRAQDGSTVNVGSIGAGVLCETAFRAAGSTIFVGSYNATGATTIAYRQNGGMIKTGAGIDL